MLPRPFSFFLGPPHLMYTLKTSAQGVREEFRHRTVGQGHEDMENHDSLGTQSLISCPSNWGGSQSSCIDLTGKHWKVPRPRVCIGFNHNPAPYQDESLGGQCGKAFPGAVSRASKLPGDRNPCQARKICTLQFS